MASFHDLKVGETLRLSGDGVVSLTLRHKSGRKARLEIDADGNIAINPVSASDHPYRITVNASRRDLMPGTNRSG